MQIKFWYSNKNLYACVLILFAFCILQIWSVMPIYPDEISFRIQSGRYIQDHGLVNGLYNICSSNIKNTPLFFVIPAWILSWIDLNLSPVQVRYIPFCIVLGIVCATVWHLTRKLKLLSAIVALTGLIGVSGSGLVLARPEYLQELNIFCCLLSYLFVQARQPRVGLRHVLSGMLIISALLSLYSHPQGLLFIPLTLYFIYRLQRGYVNNIAICLFILVFFGFSIYNSLTFNRFSCEGFPGIEKFVSQMVFSSTDLYNIKLLEWLSEKLQKYFLAFEYSNRYDANYLPAVIVSSLWEKYFLQYLNAGVVIILFVNFVAPFILILNFIIEKLVTKRNYSMSFFSSNINNNEYLPAFLLVMPVIFLYIYDLAQNFYREFFINFILAVFLALYLGFKDVSASKFRVVLNSYFLLCIMVMFLCFFLNLVWFFPRIKFGYEGPSLSLSQDLVAIDLDIKSLAKDCDMDLNKGRIVVDDMTYDRLKKYSQIYPATYLGLTAGLSQLTTTNVLDIIRPNYAIARCGVLIDTKIGFSHQRNELCCMNFGKFKLN